MEVPLVEVTGKGMVPLLAESLIRDIPDFPQPGIIFKDITPVLRDPAAFREVIDYLAERIRPLKADVIVGIESRGFVFGAPAALALGIGFVPVRKRGKLPHTTLFEEYALPYSSAVVEIHSDAVAPGVRAVIVDDLLATGGTARASARLIERLGGKVAAMEFVIELSFLNGRDALDGYAVDSLIRF